ncbi:1,2-oxophytodienoate reductase [Novosphingobium pentaromativorans US6-1]|nr:1,2-oxophytodienoate reductase [Novosphingobium pentaromativorans US6-1]
MTIGSTTLPNRIAMAPMTRNMSPGGVPDDKVAAYYRRRVEGGTGLVVTEGTYVPDPQAGFSPNVPRFYGQEALAGWSKVIDGVHAAGGCIWPQLWHVGLMPLPTDDFDVMDAISPSGLLRRDEQIGRAAQGEEIERAIHAFGEAAATAYRLGCDGIQIHGAHGYFIDQFFWDVTNLRSDDYGGDDLVTRSRTAIRIVEACRAATSPDFPISFRLSQWKQQDFTARLAETPQELERFLQPLADAGVDVFDCSTRRFWEPEFEGSDMNLAGWAKKLTGKLTSTVGSITLSNDLFSGYVEGAETSTGNLVRLLEMFERGDFDLFSVGRAAIADPAWANKVRSGYTDELAPFDIKFLMAAELN